MAQHQNISSSFFIKTSYVTYFIFGFITSTAQAQIHQPKIPQTETFKQINVNPNNEIQNNKPTSPTPNIYNQPQNNQAEQRKELDLLKQEIAKHNKVIQQPKQKVKLIDTNAYRRDLNNFENALIQLTTLAKNPNATLEEAFYITEEAFGKPYLTKQEYSNQINKSVAFIKEYMMQIIAKRNIMPFKNLCPSL